MPKIVVFRGQRQFCTFRLNHGKNTKNLAPAPCSILNHGKNMMNLAPVHRTVLHFQQQLRHRVSIRRRT